MLTHDAAMNYLSGKIVIRQTQIGGKMVKSELLDAKTVFAERPTEDTKYIVRYGLLAKAIDSDKRSDRKFEIYTLANWDASDVERLEHGGIDLLANDVRKELFDE